MLGHALAGTACRDRESKNSRNIRLFVLPKALVRLFGASCPQSSSLEASWFDWQRGNHCLQ